MNKFRIKLVTQAFNKLDRNSDGVLRVNDIKGLYNASFHPDVKSGKKTEDEILGEFLETFETHHNLKTGVRDQNVTLEEFIEYYNNVSANIDNDQYFELMISNSYKIDTKNYEAYKSNKRGEKFDMTDSNNRKERVDFHHTKTTPFGKSNYPTDYSTNLKPDAS